MSSLLVQDIPTTGSQIPNPVLRKSLESVKQTLQELLKRGGSDAKFPLYAVTSCLDDGWKDLLKTIRIDKLAFTTTAIRFLWDQGTIGKELAVDALQYYEQQHGPGAAVATNSDTKGTGAGNEAASSIDNDKEITEAGRSLFRPNGATNSNGPSPTNEGPAGASLTANSHATEAQIHQQLIEAELQRRLRNQQLQQQLQQEQLQQQSMLNLIQRRNSQAQIQQQLLQLSVQQQFQPGGIQQEQQQLQQALLWQEQQRRNSLQRRRNSLQHQQEQHRDQYLMQVLQQNQQQNLRATSDPPAARGASPAETNNDALNSTSSLKELGRTESESSKDSSSSSSKREVGKENPEDWTCVKRYDLRQNLMDHVAQKIMNGKPVLKKRASQSNPPVTAKPKKPKHTPKTASETMPMIPVLLAATTTKTAKDSILQAYDDWQASQDTVRVREVSVKQAREALQRAEAALEEQETVEEESLQALEVLVRKHYVPDRRTKRQKRLRPHR